jgi:hypothetical protein
LSAGSGEAGDWGVGGGGAGCRLQVDGEPPTRCCEAIPFGARAPDAAEGWGTAPLALEPGGGSSIRYEASGARVCSAAAPPFCREGAPL